MSKNLLHLRVGDVVSYTVGKVVKTGTVVGVTNLSASIMWNNSGPGSDVWKTAVLLGSVKGPAWAKRAD